MDTLPRWTVSHACPSTALHKSLISPFFSFPFLAEKRDSLHFDEGNLQVIDSSPRLTAVDNQHSAEKRGQKDKRNDFIHSDTRRNTNRYQAEKDFGNDLGGYESVPEIRRVRVKQIVEHQPMKSTQTPKVAQARVRGRAQANDASQSTPTLHSNGLPGFPAPAGFDPSVYYDDKDDQIPNFEFSADGAGFVLSDVAASSSEEHNHKVANDKAASAVNAHKTRHSAPSRWPANIDAIKKAINHASPPSSAEPSRPVSDLGLRGMSSANQRFLKTPASVALPTQNQDVFRVLGYENGSKSCLQEIRVIEIKTDTFCLQITLPQMNCSGYNRLVRRYFKVQWSQTKHCLLMHAFEGTCYLNDKLANGSIPRTTTFCWKVDGIEIAVDRCLNMLKMMMTRRRRKIEHHQRRKQRNSCRRKS